MVCLLAVYTELTLHKKSRAVFFAETIRMLALKVLFSMFPVVKSSNNKFLFLIIKLTTDAFVKPTFFPTNFSL